MPTKSNYEPRTRSKWPFLSRLESARISCIVNFVYRHLLLYPCVHSHDIGTVAIGEEYSTGPESDIEREKRISPRDRKFYDPSITGLKVSCCRLCSSSFANEVGTSGECLRVSYLRYSEYLGRLSEG